MTQINDINVASDGGSQEEVIRKVVIPVAGLGTRFLPASKSIPKEMLPVVDKPALQYNVEEAVAAGIHDVLMVTGRNKEAIENHFDAVPELQRNLNKKGDDARLAKVKMTNSLGRVHFVRQGKARGLGHAVLCARDHVGNEAFVVMLGDDLIDERNPVLDKMIQVRRNFGGSVLCLMEVPQDQVYMYGCAAVEQTDMEDVVRVTGLVEKPPPGEEPSNLIVIGRYLLDPKVFEVLETTEPGRGGEIQLTDALHELISTDQQDGGGVHAIIFDGLRYDTGDKLSYLQANVSLALENEELGPRFREWLNAEVLD